MTAPTLEPGDCIHIAVPASAIPALTGENVTRAYEQIGVRVFMIDHVGGLAAPVIVGVVRGVSPNIKFTT